MQLKKIELQGFKSFADKTDIDFLEGVTTIVGPNGSGKSNISDAVRWVLGEQSIKTLRGAKMEDVIFAGTQNRKKMGFAQVSLYLDNSDGTLPVEYKEVVVSRKIYRTGESGYYINNTECRLKDIQELFMDTGIGKDGYSIISQGKIDEILSTKSEERRAIFEEASGIVKYRTRKDEAVKKLEDTNINLSRINDILSEIQNNIVVLEKKAETAKMYLNLKEELKTIDVKLFLISLKANNEKLAKLNDEINTLQNDKKNQDNSLLGIEKEKTNSKERLEDIIHSIETIQEKYYELESEIEKSSYNTNLANEKIANSKINIERLSKEIQDDKLNIESLKQEINTRILKKELLDKDKSKFDLELKQKQEEQAKMLDTMSQKDLEIESVKKRIDEISDEKYDLSEKNSSIIATINADKKQLDSLISINDKALNQSNDVIFQKNDISNQVNETLKKLDNLSIDIQNINENIINKTKESENTKNEYQQLNEQIMTLNSKYNYLVNLESENEGYYRSVKGVLDYAKSTSMSNVYGTLASVISTDEKYEYAIEIALGGYLQNVVVQSDVQAKKLIEYLKQNSLGRATFLPLDSIKKYDNETSSKFKGFNGFIGIATDLVKYDRRCENAVNLALNRVIIVDNIENAIEISKKIKNSAKIVTLSGELIATTGSITGGQTKSKSTGLIGRTEKIQSLKAKIDEYKIKLENINQKLSEFKLKEDELIVNLNNKKQEKNELNILKATLEEKFNNISKEVEKIENAKKANVELKQTLQNEINSLNLNFEDNKNKIFEIENEVKIKQNEVEEYTRFNKEKQQNINILNEDIINLKISLSSFDESVNAINEMKEKLENDIKNFDEGIAKKNQIINESNEQIQSNTEKINQIQNNISELAKNKEEYVKNIEKLKSEKLECEQKQDVFELKIVQCNNIIDNIKDEIAKIENKKVKYDLDIENLKNNMWDDYELTISSSEQYLEKLSIDVNDQKDSNIAKKSDDLREQIKQLGIVDVNSIEEYKTTKDRFDFITSQKQDLDQTKGKLENLISNMTSIMKQQFSSQFKVITENFNNTFKELFGGGKANLFLNDEKNVLESGIEIEVQPPGKKLQSMMLLSGGERALTAIALLFAILKIKAPPFCILDEIEAALDDVNVQRFAEYIKKYSDNTQFIVITHRKGTMEIASSVYGITMQEYGVSKVISMKMI